MSEPAFLGLIRETLERELGGAAASILYHALATFGPRMPADFAEVVDLVHGPLRDGLSRRVGPERATSIVRDLERTLRFSEMPTSEVSRVRAREFDEQTTRSLPALGRTLEVLVLSKSETLATRLGALFSQASVRFTPIRSAGELARVEARDSVVLVDAFDGPRASPRALAAGLKDAALVLLWGSDLPACQELADAFRREHVTLMSFSSDEPIDPMLDVLRSRIP
ncbi:MAG: hypothetical protein IT378_25495 [Sandaracinaceae bacterium]|nr:hypothetical protein [Sandaracinaceae bacterium]